MGKVTKRLDRKCLLEGVTSGGVVVQRQMGMCRMFETLPSLEKLHSLMVRENTVPLSCGELTLHEVIPGDAPQRLKLDIDITVDEQGNPLKTIYPWDLMKDVTEAIEKVSMDLFGVRMCEDDWTLYSSHGRSKVSYHLVSLNHYVSDSKEAEAFATGLASESDLLDTFLDRSVYKSIQCFRILNTSKPGSELRFKQVENHPWSELAKSFVRCHQPLCMPMQDLSDSLITNVRGLAMLACSDSSKLSVVHRPFTANPSNLGEKTSFLYCIYKLLDQAHGGLAGWQNSSKVFSATICEAEARVRLTRNTPSMCLIHKRVHHSENSCIYLRGDCIGKRDPEGNLLPPSMGCKIQLELRCFRGASHGVVHLGITSMNADDKWHCAAVNLKQTSDCKYKSVRRSTHEDVKCPPASQCRDISSTPDELCPDTELRTCSVSQNDGDPHPARQPRPSLRPRKQVRMKQGEAMWKRSDIPKFDLALLDFM